MSTNPDGTRTDEEVLQIIADVQAMAARRERAVTAWDRRTDRLTPVDADPPTGRNARPGGNGSRGVSGVREWEEDRPWQDAATRQLRQDLMTLLQSARSTHSDAPPTTSRDYSMRPTDGDSARKPGDGSSLRIRRRWIRCGRPGCATCPHGPYYYLRRSSAGGRTEILLGRLTTRGQIYAALLQHLAPEQAAELMNDDERRTA
jgi:hypothetical protein